MGEEGEGGGSVRANVIISSNFVAKAVCKYGAYRTTNNLFTNSKGDKKPIIFNKILLETELKV